MKVFITGMSGLLGLNMAVQLRESFEVLGSYLTHPIHCDGIDSLQMDYGSGDPFGQILVRIQPDIVVHTAGLTSVEECEANPREAHRLNVSFAQQVARAANSMGAKLVHISTDHIFDGTSPMKREGEPPNPLNVYARTKLEAERVVLEACPDVLMIRTNFYGWGPPYRPSFSDWILKGLKNRDPLTMFSDVFYTPILINDLVDVLADLIVNRVSGVFHVAGGERISKHTFGMMLADAFGYPSDGILAISVEEHQFRAPRPRDMSLDCTKAEDLLGKQMPKVMDGLHRLRSLGSEGWPRLLEQAVSG